MDPDACLERWRSAVACGDVSEAKEARADLETWLAKGGFEPTWLNPRERNFFIDTSYVN